ncbi:SDR family NAD(P)-dependent oxidoreductase [Candidatus Dependentiae bacterium]|nr:SDR family NAD(P)-dependent oxidoreductase [Candidatus Dependentiae bacterium]
MVFYLLLAALASFVSHTEARIHNTDPKELHTQLLPVLRSQSLTRTPQKKAIIIGASSGMGNALAKRLLAEGYTVGVTARRTDRLQAILQEYPATALVRYMDVSKPEEAIVVLKQLVTDIQGIDLCVIASSGFYDQEVTVRE